MYRVVVDTNLIISGTTTANTIPYQLIESWRKGEYILVTSLQIIEEVRQVLKRTKIQKQFSLTITETNQVIETLSSHAFVTSGILEVDVVKNDPDDNKFIACALEGSASYIVSGDNHLLSIREYQGIQIVRAREFLQNCLKKS